MTGSIAATFSTPLDSVADLPAADLLRYFRLLDDMRAEEIVTMALAIGLAFGNTEARAMIDQMTAGNVRYLYNDVERQEIEKIKQELLERYGERILTPYDPCNSPLAGHRKWS